MSIFDAMKEEDEKSKYQVPNLERALAIMEHLSANPGVCTMADLSRALGYPNNSVFRIVSTLEESGYVFKDSANGKLRLSRKLLSLGYRALTEASLAESSGDILRALRDDTGETALIGCLLEGEGVVLDLALSNEPVKFMIAPGTRFSLHCSAPGKAMLAFLPEQELERQLSLCSFAKLTERTVVSKEAFLLELEAVRGEGYGVDLGEGAPGVACVGAPVFDYRRRPVAALWVTGPEFRFGASALPSAGKAAARRAKELSARLGG